MGLLSDPTCVACGIEEDSALHFICVCPTLANLRTQIFGKPILSVSEYEEMSAGSLQNLCNVQKKAVDLRLVFNKTSIMGCTLDPIIQLHPLIHPWIVREIKLGKIYTKLSDIF
jgi:hypothetical protein